MNALDHARNEAAATRAAAATAEELANAAAGPTLNLFHGVDGIRRDGLELFQTRDGDECRIAAIAAQNGVVRFWVSLPNFWSLFTPEAFGKAMARFVTPVSAGPAPKFTVDQKVRCRDLGYGYGAWTAVRDRKMVDDGFAYLIHGSESWVNEHDLEAEPGAAVIPAPDNTVVGEASLLADTTGRDSTPFGFKDQELVRAKGQVPGFGAFKLPVVEPVPGIPWLPPFRRYDVVRLKKDAASGFFKSPPGDMVVLYCREHADGWDVHVASPNGGSPPIPWTKLELVERPRKKGTPPGLTAVDDATGVATAANPGPKVTASLDIVGSTISSATVSVSVPGPAACPFRVGDTVRRRNNGGAYLDTPDVPAGTERKIWQIDEQHGGGRWILWFEDDLKSVRGGQATNYVAVPVASWQPRDIPLSAPFNRYDLVRLKPEFVTNEEIPGDPFLLVNRSPLTVNLSMGGVHEVAHCEPQRAGWGVYVCLPDDRLGYVDDYRKLDKV